MALWKIFLRLDSQILSPSLKMAVLPGLAIWIVASGWIFGSLLARLLPKALPAWLRATLQLTILAGLGAALAGAAFIGATTFHAPNLVRIWPKISLVGALYGAAAYGCSRAFRLPTHRNRPASRRYFAWAVLALWLVVIPTTLLNPDLAYPILRRNSVLGRASSWLLKPFAPELENTISGEVFRLPDRPSTGRFHGTSVVLITVDTLRRDAVSTYSQETRRTPSLKALADDAVVVEHAYVARPRSAPSMAALMTGLYPAHNGLRTNTMQLPGTVETLAENLKEAGYRTIGFTTNLLLSGRYGFDQGFDSLDLVTPHSIWKLDQSQHLNDAEAVDRAIEWLQSGDLEEPFFLWVHLFAPHPPYVPSPRLPPTQTEVSQHWLNPMNMDWMVARLENGKSAWNLATYRSIYEAEVAAVDFQVGKLIATLRDLGLYDEANVIFTADHGEAFGESDVFWHGRSTDAAELEVPFIWKLPGGIRAHTRLDTVIQQVDLSPTLSDLLGLAKTPSDGRVLSAFFTGQEEVDEGMAFGEGDYAGRFRSSRRYVLRTGHLELEWDPAYPFGAREKGSGSSSTSWNTRGSRTEVPRADWTMTLDSLARQAEKHLREVGPGPFETSEADTSRLRALGYLD